MKNELTLDTFFKKESLVKKVPEQVETLPQLPEGWKWEQLKNVSEIVNGFGFPLEFQGKTGLRYGFLKVNDMNLLGNEVYIFRTMNTVDDEIVKKIGARIYPPGTIVFPKIGGAVATNKKRILAIEASFDNNVMGIIPKEIVHPKWLYFFLCSIDLMALTKTTTMPSIRKTRVAKLQVPLPPLDVQRRVVARIEEITSRIEQAKKLREEALKDTEAIMQSALHQTFSTAEEEYGLRTLSEVCKINPSKKECRNFSESMEVTFVPMSVVSEVTGRIENPCIKLLRDVKKGYTYFKEGDVLFAKITPCMENGKSAIARNLVNGLGFGSTEFHVIRPSSQIIAEWVYYFIRQKSFRELAARNMTGSVGQQRVSEEFLKSVRIPLPPVTDQKRFVEYLDKIRARVEALRKHQEETTREIEAITQTVLKRAFNGEL